MELIYIHNKHIRKNLARHSFKNLPKASWRGGLEERPAASEGKDREYALVLREIMDPVEKQGLPAASWAFAPK